MKEETKAQIYGELLNEHTRIGNRVAEIKGQNIDLSPENKKQIDLLQSRQIQIMNEIRKLLS